MTALVVGWSGFVGRHLTRALANRGWDVRLLTFRGRPSAGLQSASGGVLSESTDPQAIEVALRGVRPDVVFHLAAAGVNPLERDPERLLDGNVRLLGSLLAALRHAPPARFIALGSCAEYAPAEPPAPIQESHSILPRGLYGAAKANATLWGHSLGSAYGIPFACLRLFHVYGPGEASGRLTRALAEGLCSGRPVDLSPGEQMRDWTHVYDVAEALIAAATAERLRYPVYNVCSARAVSIREVAATLARVLGAPPELLRFGALPYRQDEEHWVVGDNRRFREDTGWAPRLSLEEGLRTLVGVQV